MLEIFTVGEISSMVGKHKLGFPTPSSAIQESFSSIMEELSKDQITWEKMDVEFNKIFNETTKVFRASPESAKPADLLPFIYFSSSMIHVTKLGAELARIHKRLVKVEKHLTELKLANK